MDIINFKEIESTSVWARKNLSDLNDFQVVSADVQSMGHGQFERSWYSSDKNGGNIYISIVLKPENIEHLNELTRFTSYIGAKTIEKYGIKAQFKFPNDILINGKKIAGILAESVFIGNEFKGVIVGIGINLNLNKEEVKNIDIPATSIFIETGNNIDKSEFLEKLLHNFKKEYDEFLKNGMNEEARGLLKV
jgi:BirA family biotin operon repressor/biotin-[acetyl-CoA-carboxylase] ligase